MKRVLVLLLLMLLILPVNSAQVADAADTTVLYDKTFRDLSGTNFALKDLRGRYALINFWARWCSPCRQEIPDLVKAHARYQEQGLTVIGIALEENQQNIADFAKAYEINYPVLIAGLEEGLTLSKTLGNDKQSIPFSVLIDRNGRIMVSKYGSFKPGELDDTLEKQFSAEK